MFATSMIRRRVRPTPSPAPLLVVDTDGGIDDVLALAVAVRSPECELVAATTTYGNTSLARATRNVRTALRLAGHPDLPILAGSARPLVRQAPPPSPLHGRSGVGFAPVPPARPVHPRPLALLEVLRQAPQPVWLLTLGPLTNLARAIQADPLTVRRQIRRHVASLGALQVAGGPDRPADFNAWADPEAADRVLRAALPTQLVPLDLASQAPLPPELITQLARSAEPLGPWLAAALQFSLQAHRLHRAAESCWVPDLLALAAVLVPQIFSFAWHRLAIGLDDDLERGHTREHDHGIPIQVATGLDVRHMASLLARLSPA